MSGATGQPDDYGTIQRCRRGDRRACRELVDRCQPEVLRTAFLLTGDARQAIAISIAAFETIITELPGIDDDEQLRRKLLEALTSALLTVDHSAGPDEPTLPGMVTTRYQVDDERSRTRQALLRLDLSERAALVLYIFNALPAERAGRMANIDPADVRRTLDRVGERLRSSFDWPGDQPLRIPLAEASIDAPRTSLWPELESAFERLQQRERQRSQLIVVGAAIGTFAFLAIIVAVLIGFNRSDNAADTVASTATQRLARSTITPGQIVVTPTPTPVASVPDAMIASDGARVVIYQPRIGRQHWGIDQSEAAALSPDGSQIFAARVIRDGPMLRATVAGAEVETDGEEWETEVLRLEELTDPQSAAFTIDVAASDTYVYVAFRAWQVSGPLTVMTLDRQSGAILRTYERAYTGPITGQVGLEVRSDDSELYLLIVAQWQEVFGRVDYFRFALPSMRIEQLAQPVGGDSNANFLFWASHMLPDHSGLYRVTYTGDGGSVIVRFFDFEQGSVSQIALPFRSLPNEASQPNGTPIPFETVASHDGQWLYVFDPASGEVAIVDLGARQLDRLIPLEMGEFAPAYPGPVTASSPVRPGGQFMQFSADGLELYATAIAFDRTFAVTDGVWVIDTRTWRIVDHWFRGRPVAALVLSAKTLYIQSEVIQSQNPLTTVNPFPVSAVDTASGELTAPAQPPLTWNISIASLADLYRRQYGYSPLSGQDRPVDNRDFSTLTRLDVSVNKDLISEGGSVSVDIRFIDPATGQPVEVDAPGIRYQPPQSLTLVFTSGDGASVLVLPSQLSHGHYRADARLDTAGSWDLEIVSQGDLIAGGPTRLSAAVTVLPALAALDQCAPVTTANDSTRTPTRGECWFR